MVTKQGKIIEKELKSYAYITNEYMPELNDLFFDYVDNPINPNKFRTQRDIILASWLAMMFERLEFDLFNSAQTGIDLADKQLIAKNKEIKLVTDLQTYELALNEREIALKQDLNILSENIKGNTDRIMREIAQGKEISVSKLKKNGVTYFTDKIEREIPIDVYIEMKMTTEIVRAQRQSFFMRAQQYDIDLVRCKHLNIHPTCKLCISFEDKILSIKGKTEGYMTWEEAELYGLGHPRCDHVPEYLELDPEDSGYEGKIKLNEFNQKRYEYNKKRML